jgi:ubiquinone/menaquinone biosynthesis C-methylase UbiE
MRTTGNRGDTGKGRREDGLPDLSYRLMVALFKLGDAVYPTVARRTRGFGIKPGMTVVDYGCGPGRYTFPFARFRTGSSACSDVL